MQGGPLIGEGLIADGVLIDCPSPLGKIWFPLSRELTVLYGRNGAGKTLLLKSIAGALGGVAPLHGEVSVHLSIDARSSGFDHRLAVKLMEPLWRATGIEGGGAFEGVLGDEAGRVELGAHQEEIWERFLAAMQGRLSELASSFGTTRGLAHTPRLALVARGTASEPAWDAYISVVPSSSSFASELGIDLDPAEAQGIAPGRRSFLPYSAVSYVEGAPVIVAPLPESSAPLHRPAVRLSSKVGLPLIGCLNADDDLDVDVTTLVDLQHLSPTEDGDPQVVEFVDGKDIGLGMVARQAAAALAETASSIFESLTGRPMRLEPIVEHPNTWLNGKKPLHWAGEDEQGVRLPINKLGSGWSRWAGLAISMAIARERLDEDAPLVVLVDEPERALHTAAQRDIARSMISTLSNLELSRGCLHAVVVASHAPAFLSEKNVRLVHVSRDGQGLVRLDSIDPTADVTALSASLGVVETDVLGLVRWFIYVEGEHDVAVLQSCFPEKLREGHARLLPMRGASNIAAAMSFSFVLDYTDAKVRVVLDRIGAASADHWRQAAQAFSGSDRAGARRCLESIGRRSDRESRWLYEAGIQALERGHLDRIQVVGLEQPDIINYLPVSAFVPGAADWVGLSKEWRASKSGLDFKSWLRQAKGAEINPSRLAEIAQHLVEYADLERVVMGL